MHNVNVKTWVGFLINVAVTIVFFCTEMADGGSRAVAFFSIPLAGIILTGMGIAMLVRGNPTGGILGMVGSALFVPIGLICLIGCQQCRDKLRQAALATAGAPGSGTDAASAEAPAATRESRPAPEEAPVAAAVAAVAPADEKSGIPESVAGSDGTPTTEETPAAMVSVAPGAGGGTTRAEAPAAPAETPLAACGFADERGWGWVLVLGSIALFFFALYHGTAIASGSLVCFIMGIIYIIQGQQRQGMHACVLYRDRLECVISMWTSDRISIPYAGIREARCSGSRLRLQIASGEGTTKVTIYFGLFESKKRDEIRTALQDKMRELGVLREN